MSAYSTTTEEADTDSYYDDDEDDESDTDNYALPFDSLGTELENSCHTQDPFGSNKHEFEPMMEIRNEHNYYSSEYEDDDDDDDCQSLMSLSTTEISRNSDCEFEDFEFNNELHTDDYHLINFPKHNKESMDVMMEELEAMNKWINILNSMNISTNPIKKMHKNLFVEIASYSANEFRLKQQNIDINDLYHDTNMKIINTDNVFDKYPNGQLINVSIDGYSMHELRFKHQYIYNEINYLDPTQFHVIDVDQDYNDNNTDDTDSDHIPSPITDEYPSFDEIDIYLNDCFSEHRGKILSATTYIQNNVWDSSEYQVLIDLGLIPRFIEMLESDSNKLIYNVVSILNRILDEYPDNAIYYKSAIPALCKLVSSPSRRIKQYTLSIIRSICDNVALYRDDILENNILYSLIDLIMNVNINPVTIYNLSMDHRKLLRNIVGVLLAICSKDLSQIFDTTYIDEKYVSEILTGCNILIQTEDEEIVQNVFSVYKYLMDLNNDKHIFDGDIVFNGDEYVKQCNTKRNMLLLSGFVRDISPDIKLSSDVEGKCLNFMETLSINDQFEIDLYEYCMNFVGDNKSSIYINNISNILANGCNNTKTRLKSVANLRSLLSVTEDPPNQAVVDTGVVPKLIEFLQCSDETELQFEAAWALTNIVSREIEHTKCVIDHGAIPIFINLLRSPTLNVRAQSIWALGNITGENTECRDLVLNAGILDNLLLICHDDLNTSEDMDILRNVAWVLSNLCTGRPRPQWMFVKLMVKGLNILLHCSDEEVLNSTISAYDQLCRHDPNAEDNDDEDNDEDIDIDVDQRRCFDDTHFNVILNEDDTMDKIINALQHEQEDIVGVALKCIGDIAVASDLMIELLVNKGVLKKLKTIISNNDETAITASTSIQKDACWIMSSITTIDAVIQSVMDENLYDLLMDAMKNKCYIIAHEALWAISNTVMINNNLQIKYLVDHGVISALCTFLEKYRWGRGNEVMLVTMDTIECILNIEAKNNESNNNNNNNDDDKELSEYAKMFKHDNGLQYIQEIKQSSSSNELGQKTNNILQQYFYQNDNDNVFDIPLCDDIDF